MFSQQREGERHAFISYNHISFQYGASKAKSAMFSPLLIQTLLLETVLFSIINFLAAILCWLQLYTV